jgi:hypothetical protein
MAWPFVKWGQNSCPCFEVLSTPWDRAKHGSAVCMHDSQPLPLRLAAHEASQPQKDVFSLLRVCWVPTMAMLQFCLAQLASEAALSGSWGTGGGQVLVDTPRGPRKRGACNQHAQSRPWSCKGANTLENVSFYIGVPLMGVEGWSSVENVFRSLLPGPWVFSDIVPSSRPNLQATGAASTLELNLWKGSKGERQALGGRWPADGGIHTGR